MAKYLGIPIALAYGETDTATGNNLVDSTASFESDVKVGDIVFNTTDNTEAIITSITSDSIIVLSAPIAQTSAEGYAIFAPNDDTRGNQILRTDNYQISQWQEASPDNDSVIIWFQNGIGTNMAKVTLAQIMNASASNPNFIEEVIEDYVLRLDAQSGTASRLDIPLNNFRDHVNSVVLLTKTITIG